MNIEIIHIFQFILELYLRDVQISIFLPLIIIYQCIASEDRCKQEFYIRDIHGGRFLREHSRKMHDFVHRTSGSANVTYEMQGISSFTKNSSSRK